MFVMNKVFGWLNRNNCIACGVFLMGMGSFLTSCSEESDKPSAPSTPPSTEEEAQQNADAAKDEILVTDWEAEGAKENGLTKKTAPKLGLPEAGFYDEALTVDIPAPQYGGEVRCTFDGNEPTLETAAVEGPVTIDTSKVARCTEFIGDSVAAKSVETYFIGETVSMPVVAVTVPPWYYKQILKAEPCKPDPCSDADFWLDTAVVAHVEYFPNGSKSDVKAFEVDMEASIMGGYSRNQKKKSLSLNMKKKLQKGHFRYPLFDTRPNQKKFKGFILRNNGNRFVSDYLEDAMATSLLEGTQVDYQRSRQVVVFYNGIYYGIHDMREKLNEHFVETNYGIDAEAVDFIKHAGRSVEASGGTTDDYVDLLNFISASDLTGENNKAYAAVKARMNVQSYMEYMAAEIYYHNGDWPNNNLRVWRSGTQKWKFVAYDLDHGFDWEWGVSGFSQSTNMFKWIKQGGNGHCSVKSGDGSNPLCFHNVFVKLNTNPEFVRSFINRAAVIYSSYVNAGRVAEATNRMAATIPDAESSRDMKKFDREKLYYKNSCGKGFSVSGSCIKEWAEERDAANRNEWRAEYGLGADVNVEFAVAGNGEILLDGMSLPSRNYAGKFFAGNPMVLTAKGEGFVGWEDGSTDNPRVVVPTEATAFGATFQ